MRYVNLHAGLITIEVGEATPRIYQQDHLIMLVSCTYGKGIADPKPYEYTTNRKIS